MIALFAKEETKPQTVDAAIAAVVKTVEDLEYVRDIHRQREHRAELEAAEASARALEAKKEAGRAEGMAQRFRELLGL